MQISALHLAALLLTGAIDSGKHSADDEDEFTGESTSAAGAIAGAGRGHPQAVSARQKQSD
ncbi:hypothetical protein PF005_g14043 [Phytophthora fragariae]|uniref:RxLR effector protein n=1 Tax=Phytophthora fragariae TaxID=53985 RepID=A0A6A3EWF9_9STRA|nr:hypothetical protein PF003_g12647 [Phytophthora fragariae]KAE8936993.1 hypothetical protein PF009_g13100 [Phytophthora fragariae]KAE9002214.1 hypothetical protein PF011_g13411 [Phytophthora fragariae]KAE9099813.1 hypothetical protein PF007_g15741 [Phytophthora fragariae]KAE9100199.1 hypothetical protein PF010_g14899 [Phytophthora fragariae]